MGTDTGPQPTSWPGGLRRMFHCPVNSDCLYRSQYRASGVGGARRQSARDGQRRLVDDPGHVHELYRFDYLPFFKASGQSYSMPEL